MDWKFDSDGYKSGRLAERLYDHAWEALRYDTLLPYLDPPRPRTRRERLRARLAEAAYRIRLAWRVLRHGEIDE
jgi:hypothetical protein